MHGAKALLLRGAPLWVDLPPLFDSRAPTAVFLNTTVPAALFCAEFSPVLLLVCPPAVCWFPLPAPPGYTPEEAMRVLKEEAHRLAEMSPQV